MSRTSSSEWDEWDVYRFFFLPPLLSCPLIVPHPCFPPGKYVYFVPGCSFFTPTAHLKKSVRDNGGVIVYNPSVATTIVCNKQQRGAWGGGGLSGGVMVVADNWITNAVSRGSLSSWR